MTQRLLLLAGLSVVVLLALAYSNAFSNDFHFDDAHVIVNNLYIRSLRNVPLFFTDAHTFSSLAYNATYRPLLTLTYAIDYAIAGQLDPRQFHLTQFLLLLILGFCLYLFFVRIFEKARPDPANAFIALFAAALFVIHITNTETFNLISSRSDLLSSLFVVLAFLAYDREGWMRRFHFYLVPLVLGGLVKATVVVLAPLLLAYLLLVERKRFMDALRSSAPVWVVAGLMLWFLDSMNAPEWIAGGGDRIDYLRTQTWVWLRYFRLFFLPVGLSADTDLAPIREWTDGRVILGLLFLIALIWMIRRSSAKLRTVPIAFGLVWFALGLLPTSSIFPLAEMMNEHRIFFPYIGLALASAWTLALLLPPRIAVVAGAVVLVALAAGTYKRNEVWRTEETLWLDVTEKSPRNGRGLMNYGLARMSAGDNVTALRYFERALDLIPRYPTLHINLAIVKDRLGHAAAVESHFQRALALRQDADGHFYYGRWLISRGRGPEAIAHLQDAVRYAAGSPFPRSLLLNLYAARGSPAELLSGIMETQRLDPSDPTAMRLAGHLIGEPAPDPAAMMKLARVAVARSDAVETAIACRAAIRSAPGSLEARNTLGWALTALGFIPEALEVLEPLVLEYPDVKEPRINRDWALQRLKTEN